MRKWYFVIFLFFMTACVGQKPAEGKSTEGWKPPERWWQVPDDVKSGYGIIRKANDLVIEDSEAVAELLITMEHGWWYQTRSAVKRRSKYVVVYLDFEEGYVRGKNYRRGWISKHISSHTKIITNFYWKIEDKYLWLSVDGETWYRALLGASDKDDEYFYIRCDPVGVEGYFALEAFEE